MKTEDDFQDSLKNEEIRDRVLSTVRIVPLFVKFSTDEVEELLAIAKCVKYEPLETIFEEGSSDRKLHMILEGTVTLHARGSGGNDVILSQKAHDTCFGEIAFITGGKRNTGAKAGPNGSRNMTIGAEDFQQLASLHPELLFKVLGTIIDSVNERLQDLPTNFRNFVVWGMNRPGLDKDSAELDISLPGIGCAVGLIAGGIAGNQAGSAILRLYPMLQPVPWIGKAAMWFCCLLIGVCGAFAGWWMAIQKLKRRSGGVGPRCCMNCAFVVWDGVPGKFGCAYQALKLKGKVLRPGKDYDSPTNCPTFQFRDISRLG